MIIPKPFQFQRRPTFGAKKPKLDAQVSHVANIFRAAKDLSPAFVASMARQYGVRLATAEEMAERERVRRAASG